MTNHAINITGFVDGVLMVQKAETVANINKYHFRAEYDPKFLSGDVYVCSDFISDADAIKCEAGDGGRSVHPGAPGL